MNTNKYFTVGILCLTFMNLSFSKFEIEPKYDEAFEGDSIIIYVPIFDFNSHQIVHHVTSDEKTNIVNSNEIEIVNIFNDITNDTLPPVQVLNKEYFRAWGKIELGPLKSGQYKILWEGNVKMTYEVKPRIGTSVIKRKNRIIQPSATYTFLNKYFKLNGAIIK